MASTLRASELPDLSPSERQQAERVGMTPEAYARAIVAGERSQETLRNKAERLGRLLQSELDRQAPGAVVKKIWFRVYQEAFEVAVQDGGQTIPLRIVETAVNDAFEAGSPDAEARIRRIVDLAVSRRVQ